MDKIANAREEIGRQIRYHKAEKNETAISSLNLIDEILLGQNLDEFKWLLCRKIMEAKNKEAVAKLLTDSQCFIKVIGEQLDK